MKKYIYSSLLLGVFLIAPKVHATIIEDLQAQIQILQQQLLVNQRNQDPNSHQAEFEASNLETSLNNASTNTSGSGSSSQSASQSGLTLTRNLGVGSIGADVVALQGFLRRLSFFSGDSDVFFGQRTFQAVMQFQASNRIEATGYVGTLTRAFLASYGSNNGSNNPQTTTSNPTTTNGASLILSASQNYVAAGQNVTLSWSTTKVGYCSLTNSLDGSSIGVGIPSSYRTVNPTKTTTYTVTCGGDSGSISKSVTVAVAGDTTTGITIPKIDLKVNGSDGPISLAYNTSANLTWTSTGAVSGCQIFQKAGDSNVPVGSSGSMSTGNLNQYANFFVSCNNDSISDNVVINVQPAGDNSLPSVSLTADQTSIQAGSMSVVTITSSNATQCFSNIPGYDGRLNGNIKVFPSVTTTYTITCSNYVGQSAGTKISVVVNNVTTLPSPTINISASPATITAGQSSTLSWSSENSNYGCSSDDFFTGTKPIGSAVVSPSLSKTFKITCVNGTIGGFNPAASLYSSANTTVTVNQPATGGTQNDPSTKPLTVTLTSPGTISPGQSAALMITGSNIYYCKSSAGQQYDGTVSGANPDHNIISIVYPSATTKYTVTCYNSYGQTVTSDTTVTVSGTQGANVYTAMINILKEIQKQLNALK